MPQRKKSSGMIDDEKYLVRGGAAVGVGVGVGVGMVGRVGGRMW